MRDIKLAAYSDLLGRAAIEVFNIRIENGVIKAFEYTDNGEESECQIVQFTGLTDCNGVDIYTGDILKEKNRNVTWQVKHGEYELDSRFDSYQNQCVGFYVERITSLPSDTDCIGDTDWIVIGNIYQNPELLENNQ